MLDSVVTAGGQVQNGRQGYLKEINHRRSRKEGGASVAVTKAGVGPELCCTFSAQSRTFSQRHPVVYHLTTLSMRTICDLLHPCAMHYSSISKELLFIFPYFLLLLCVGLHVHMCVLVAHEGN